MKRDFVVVKITHEPDWTSKMLLRKEDERDWCLKFNRNVINKMGIKQGSVISIDRENFEV